MTMKRKRSSSVKLLLMGAAPLALAGCEAQQDAVLYANAQECIAGGQLDAAKCEQLYQQAQNENERVAPRYSRYEECVRDFGEGMCNKNPTSGGFFIPFVQGMLIGNLLSGGGAYYPQPVYRPRNGGWTTPGGDYIGNRTGQIRVPSHTTKPQSRAITMSRAGFGSRAAARGSWGG